MPKLNFSFPPFFPDRRRKSYVVFQDSITNSLAAGQKMIVSEVELIPLSGTGRVANFPSKCAVSILI